MEYGKKPPIAAQYLNGVSPRARGLQKQNTVLDWVYRWGHSTADVIRQVSGQQANGYAKRLAEKGLLKATKTVTGSPKLYFTLTEAGLQDVERRAYDLYNYPELDQYRVNQQQIRHYLLAQRATMNALDTDQIDDFLTERMTHEADTAGKKRPDVTWLLPDESRWGIEIELSAKWERRLDQFVYDIYRALAQGSYSRFCVVTDSEAIQHRYEEAFCQASIPIWGKDSRGRWERNNEVELPDWLRDRVTLMLITDF